MSKLDPELSNRLALVRKAAGITQEQLAAAAEVSRQTVGAVEKGEYNPSTLLALRFAVLLGVRVEELFWLEERVVEELVDKRLKLGVSERGESDAPEGLVARVEGAE